jgi:hypothetical protein
MLLGVPSSFCRRLDEEGIAIDVRDLHLSKA